MQPNTVNPFTFQPFNASLDYPASNPDATPSVTVTFACEWLPRIRGALSVLTQQWSWKQTTLEQVLLAQQQAMTLIAMFTECTGGYPPIACPYDFQDSSAGWFQSGFCGAYVGGTGWVSGASPYGDCVQIQHSVTGHNTISHIQFVFSSEVVGAGPNNGEDVQVHYGGAWHDIYHVNLRNGVHVVDLFGTWTDVDAIRVGTNAGDNTGEQIIFSARYDGVGDNGCE